MSSIRGFNIKNHGCYYPYIIDIKDLNLDKILVYKRQFTEKKKIFIMSQTKPRTVKNPCVLVLVTYMDILKKMVEIVI